MWVIVGAIFIMWVIHKFFQSLAGTYTPMPTQRIAELEEQGLLRRSIDVEREEEEKKKQDEIRKIWNS